MRAAAGFTLAVVIILLGALLDWHRPGVFLAQTVLLIVELWLLWPRLRRKAAA